ncbi:MAG: Lrp/AsnC ligand binding domain-containing protein [Nitrospirota bacterium]
MPRKPKSIAAASAHATSVLTPPQGVRYGEPQPAPPAIPFTIHAPSAGAPLMSDRAYIMINVNPGLTSSVVKALGQIKAIKIIDPCWGKPDIIVVADVADQDALTQLVLSKIHGIEGVTQTDTHLVYRTTESKAK